MSAPLRHRHFFQISDKIERFSDKIESVSDKIERFSDKIESFRTKLKVCCVLILVDSFVLLILTWFTLYFSYSYTGCQFMTLFLFQFTH